MRADGYTFSLTNRRADSDEDIAEVIGLYNLLQTEESPDEPPYSAVTVAARVRAQPAWRTLWQIRARAEDGTLAAVTTMRKDWLYDDNPDVGSLDAAVHPAHRRRGLATQLVAAQVALAQELDRTRLVFTTTDRQPAGEELAGAIGAVVRSRLHENELLLPGVSRPAMEAWARPIDGYALMMVDGPVPDAIVDEFVALLGVMNDAPNDDLVINDERLTVAQLRSGEAQSAAAGTETWRAVVRHLDTGDLVGVHLVGWGPDAPLTVYVGDTGVVRAHRGHGLSRWMKAQMTLRVLQERPEATTIRTENADSNAAMLAINAGLGYQPRMAEATWEVAVSTVSTWLASKGVALPEVRADVDAQRPQS